MATMQTREATPMNTPSIVSTERRPLRRMADPAAATVIQTNAGPAPRPVPARAALARAWAPGGVPGCLRSSETIRPSRMVSTRAA